jgi:hypothetical protein
VSKKKTRRQQKKKGAGRPAQTKTETRISNSRKPKRFRAMEEWSQHFYEYRRPNARRVLASLGVTWGDTDDVISDLIVGCIARPKFRRLGATRKTQYVLASLYHAAAEWGRRRMKQQILLDLASSNLTTSNSGSDSTDEGPLSWAPEWMLDGMRDGTDAQHFTTIDRALDEVGGAGEDALVRCERHRRYLFRQPCGVPRKIISKAVMKMRGVTRTCLDQANRRLRLKWLRLSSELRIVSMERDMPRGVS